MRKTATALLVVGLTAIMVSPALAATLMSDNFSYPDGNLVPNGGWANYSGAATDIQVVSGRATGGAIGNPANDDHKLFTAQGLTDKTYACFNVKIPTPPVAGDPKPIYFAELKDGGATLLVARVYVLPLGSGAWTFGISYSSTNTTALGATPWGSALSYDTEYTVATLYDPTTSSATLWVDPVTEASTSVSNVGTSPAIAVSGFGLRQSNSVSSFPPPGYVGTVDWNFSVDNVGVGTTFDDACASGPTPTRRPTWGQLKTIYRQ